MLTRPRIRGTFLGGARLVGALLLVLAGLLGTAGTAHASVTPCDNSYVCVIVGTPGSGGGSGGGGGGGPVGAGGGPCHYSNRIVPCSIAGIGTLDSSDGCYYIEMQPQPPAGDPLWQGHQPGDGAIYIRTCALNGGGGTVSLWMAAAPPAPIQVTPAQLAHLAVRRLKLLRATAMTAPGDGNPGLVNLPVMLYLKPLGVGNYGHTYADYAHRLWVTASVPGLSVTAQVWSTKVTWVMDDGHDVVCLSPGVDYQYVKRFVSGCNYTYHKANSDYAISAYVSWTVTWSGGGQAGAFNMNRIPAPGIDLKVEEVQVLN